MKLDDVYLNYQEIIKYVVYLFYSRKRKFIERHSHSFSFSLSPLLILLLLYFCSLTRTSWDSLMTQMVKNLTAVRETWV